MTEAPTVVSTGLKEMGTNQPWNLKSTVFKTIKMMLVRSLRTRWRWLLQITMLFLHVTPPLPTLSIKALTLRLLGRWGVGLWKDVHHPHPTVTSTLNKANYPFYQPGLSIGFWAARGSKAFDCVDHNKLWKILKEMGIPDHLTCLLRNLYTGQEATVNRLVPNRKRSTSRLYIVTLLI